jgi:AcrR family transcriptional regulator
MDVQIRVRRSLLDAVAEVLVADPGASLAEVAEAVGISRTTLHNHYATRVDLLRAVGNRVIDLWEQAIDKVEDGPDGGLRAMTELLLPLCPQLAFLWRNPSFDKLPDMEERWIAAETCGLDVLKRAQKRGVIVAAVPEWWLLGSLYSLLYVAAERVAGGRLAPLDAPDLVLSTYLNGIGANPQPGGSDHE